jgi:protein disulfide-isomerase
MKFKFMSMLGLCLAGIFTFAVNGKAAEANWLTDYDQALAQAKQENKKVLIDFTGSTWCPPCIQMHKEVLTQKEFIDYAGKNLVLLLVDLPRGNQPSAAV